jgi:Raf kinase inhibitor-like YbhB/YbcL family protein
MAGRTETVMGARRAWCALLLLAACGGDGGVGTDGDAVLEVTSPGVVEGGQVPVEHTCDGTDEPPELAWSAAPSEAEEVLVVVDDPDAPGGTFTHWTVWGLDPDASPLTIPLPAGAIEGTNDFGEVGYRGPCPPEGDEEHGYRFRVIALAQPLELPTAATAEELAGAIEGRVLGEGQLTAVYGR